MGAEFKDYYKVLGVDESAGQDEIKRAFRTLARKHHPDVNKGRDHEARFKEVSEAYEVLGDDNKRAEYDQLYAYWKHGGSFNGAPGYEGNGGFEFHQTGSGVNFEELFSRLFGERSGTSGAAEWFSDFTGHNGNHTSGFGGSFNFNPQPHPPAHEIVMNSFLPL
ncbi:MAG: DnaJ domain-containing protein [Magnetococcales bacterium]|nr:DnaJ domain-containing protein [Magnetococcales bacterium]